MIIIKYVFLESDFENIDEIDNLILKGEIFKISTNVYALTKRNRITQKLMYSHPLGKDGVLIDLLELLNINYEYLGLSKKYINGETNQIPSKLEIKFTTKIPIYIYKII
jgi:hypothetical protein